MKSFILIIQLVLIVNVKVYASCKSLVLQIYLNQVDQMIQSHQFSEAKKTLTLLEALFPNDADVQKKARTRY
jgi:hypothetical protein